MGTLCALLEINRMRPLNTVPPVRQGRRTSLVPTHSSVARCSALREGSRQTSVLHSTVKISSAMVVSALASAAFAGSAAAGNSRASSWPSAAAHPASSSAACVPHTCSFHCCEAVSDVRVGQSCLQWSFGHVCGRVLIGMKRGKETSAGTCPPQTIVKAAP